ncbi:MAG: hypothetical protein AB1512_02945 [Thermodesulfobacteriota bacterium]
MGRGFNRESVVRSYRWLGHMPGWTEFSAFHPLYRPGRENLEHNRLNRAFPVVRYVRSEAWLLRLVERYHGTHMVCYGINPRPGMKRYASGHPRAHRDSEIELVKNFFFDFDPGAGSGDMGAAELGLLLEEVAGRVEAAGFGPPVKAFTGRGYHLLFAVPAIRVEQFPDLSLRIKAFRESVLLPFRGRLSSLGAKADSTDDLSRMAKVYGTAKPGSHRLSEFPEDARRVEDGRLREHLLSLEVEECEGPGGVMAAVPGELPEGFSRLLESDGRVRSLWQGQGKAAGDLSRSGYDYSLVRECMARGITDVVDLAAILALRPGGSVQEGHKGGQYIRATIARAVRDFRWGTG